jgi:thioester reductase-like protein
VRGDDPAHCQSRLQALFGVYDPQGALSELFAERVVPVRGDVSLPHLGLDAETYAGLQDTVDLTIHAAANTSLLASFERVEPINVGGTARMIDFCLGTRRQSLCYVSTYTVMGSKTFDPSFTFKESDFDLGQTFEFMNYQRTKFMAETMVRQAAERGLRFKIFRPGQIFGESDTGYYPQGDTQVSGLFYDLIKTAIETGLAFHSDTHFDVVPVDYVSQALVKLALDRPHWGETYHLVNPDVRTYSEIIRLVQQLGYSIQQLPEVEYKKLLVAGQVRKHGESRPYESVSMKAFMAWFLKAGISFEKSSITDCEFTREVLEPLGVRCPRLDLTLIRTYVQNGVKQGYLPELRSSAAPHRSDASPREAVLGLAPLGV